MRGLTFFIFLFSSAIALIAPPGGTVIPHYSTFTQIDLMQNLMPTIWGRNYSLAVIGSRCPPSATPAQQASYNGKILIYSYTEFRGSCTHQAITNYFNQFNPLGHVFIDLFTAFRAVGATSPYQPVSNLKPVWHAGADVTVPLRDILAGFPGVLFAPNMTATLDYPSQNPIVQGPHIPGTPLQLNYLAIALGLVGMLLCIWKLSIFVHAFGIQLSIAQMILSLCFTSSLFVFLVLGLFGIYSSNSELITSSDIQESFIWPTLGFMYSAVVVLGFYFVEVSQLTQASSVQGISKLKIPAIIFLVILWAVVIAVAVVEGEDPLFINLNDVNGSALYVFFFSWLGVIVPFACTCVLAFGSVMLLISLSDAGQKGPILRIVLASVGVIAFIWSFCLVAIWMNYLPGGEAPWDVTPNWSAVEYYCYRNMFWTLGIMGVNIVMPLVFSVAVQKEIEVSKSGTSSTSGSSKSSSSSSSSSSHGADPVIEL